MTGEVIGYNDIYRIIDGTDPITGQKLNDKQIAVAVTWTLLNFIPPIKLLKLGKVTKATKPVRGVKQLAPKEKLSKLKDLTNTKSQTVNKKLDQFTDKQLKAIQDFLNKYGEPFQLPSMYRDPALAGGPNNVLSNKQIYPIKNSDDVRLNGNAFDNISTKVQVIMGRSRVS
mgnify:CR=1 FL=1